MTDPETEQISADRARGIRRLLLVVIGFAVIALCLAAATLRRRTP